MFQCDFNLRNRILPCKSTSYSVCSNVPVFFRYIGTGGVNLCARRGAASSSLKLKNRTNREGGGIYPLKSLEHRNNVNISILITN